MLKINLNYKPALPTPKTIRNGASLERMARLVDYETGFSVDYYPNSLTVIPGLCFQIFYALRYGDLGRTADLTLGTNSTQRSLVQVYLTLLPGGNIV